jgi:hypothetical protein
MCIDDKNPHEEKCIQLARKPLRFQQKWGRRAGVLYLVMAAACIGLCFAFLGLTWKMVEFLAGNAPNGQQPGRGLIGPSCAVGLMLGFLAGYVGYKGLYCFGEAIKSFRGDRTDQLLVKYHDGITALMQNQAAFSEEPSKADPPKTPPATDQPGG